MNFCVTFTQINDQINFFLHSHHFIITIQRTSPPFHADINGSFLRRQCIKDARIQFNEGKISASEKDAIEEREVVKLVEHQKSIELQVVCDGEFRREWYHLDFLVGLSGVEKYTVEHGFRFPDGTETKSHRCRIIGKIDFPDDH